MSIRNEPSLRSTQLQHSTPDGPSGDFHHIEPTSPVPHGGMFNYARDTQVHHSNFYDISRSTQPVIHNSNNVTNNYGRPSAMPDLYQLLQPVNASYESRDGNVARCMLGTRKKVLKKIKKWADSSRPICWLNDPAGSGKSTIAQTIAEWYTNEGRLAASFFFFRGTGDRDEITHLIPTLAVQLSSTVKGMESLIKNILEKEPSITSKSIRYQFHKLIMEPMLSCTPSRTVQDIFGRKDMVIVIDALDECESQDAGASMDEFIDTVIDACEAKKGQVPFRLFITSRIEEHLRIRLEASNAKNVTLQLKLQNFNAAKDIRIFFQSEFKGIYDVHHLAMAAEGIREPWPSSEILDTLVKEAAGSYIYASTFVNFVRKAEGMPHQKLLDALRAHGLDEVYTQVFSKALHAAGVPGGTVDLRRAIGALLLLQHPLSIQHLAALLNIASRNLVKSFLSVQSILLVPESDNDPVHLVHTSLRDYLMTQARSGIYFINPPTCHLSIVIDCLNIMQRHNEEFWFTDGALLYAYRRWLDHVHKALSEGEQDPSDPSLFVSLKDSLMSFSSSSLHAWIHSIIRNGNAKDIMIRLSPQELLRCPQDLQWTLTSINKMLKYAMVMIIHFLGKLNWLLNKLNDWLLNNDDILDILLNKLNWWHQDFQNRHLKDHEVREMIIRWRTNGRLPAFRFQTGESVFEEVS